MNTFFLQQKYRLQKVITAVLILAMIFSLAPAGGLTVQAAPAEVTGTDYIDLQSTSTDKELYVGTDWGGSQAAYGTAANAAQEVITVSNFGTGGSNEWALQYMVKNLGLTAGTQYQVSFNITSTVDKNIFVKLDDTGLIAETVTLTADTQYQYAKTTEAGTPGNNIFYIAFGRTGSEAADLSGTVTIENLVIQPVSSGGGTTDTSVGPEYDFSDTTGDTADPGKTKAGYDLIWSDEFDGNYGTDQTDTATGLDLSKWAYQLGDGTTEAGNPGWGNRELESYTANSANIGVNEDLNNDSQNDGLLRITAKSEASGYVYGTENSKNYTSARIRTTKDTEALFTTTYGYVEARIALPATKGAWPAFWMLPETTDIYGGWPVSGEIDAMETCGAFTEGKHNTACGTLHWGKPDHVYKGSGYVTLGADYTKFHTYAVDWQPGKITWYYDGTAVNTISDWEGSFAGATDSLSFDAPFDQPFYMILNLAVDSGQFGGTVNAATFQGSMNMYVDYVRVFQKTAGYTAQVVRTGSGDRKSDWQSYAGINQTADMTDTNLVNDVADGNVNALEKAGTADPAKWYLSYQSDAKDAAASTVTGSDGKYWEKVTVTTPGSQDYSVQLIGHYNAEAGYLYQISFDAYADGALIGKSVNCDSKEWKGWSTYGLKAFELQSASTHYSFLVDQTDTFDNCRIEFNLGAKGSGNVYIGNVRAEIVDPALINQEKEKEAQADGNLIYNGTFDEGTGHFGYWSAGAQTTVSIPRYTTEKAADTDIQVVDVASVSNYEQVPGGIKYYERRAQISAPAGSRPQIWQPDLNMPADQYTFNFDLYACADTSVEAAIYKVDVNGTEEKLGAKVSSGTAVYSAADGVKNYTWNFELTEPVANAALVLTFGDGSSVQADNVTLKEASLVPKVDQTPVDAGTTWSGDSGSGETLSVASTDGIFSLNGISSGTAWYAPQIVSSDFALTVDKQYQLSFRYKMGGTSNNSFAYIVQENGGSWTVFGDGPTTLHYDSANADTNGFCSYTKTFTAGVSLPNVRIVFGFGGSAADGDLNFLYRDVALTLIDTAGTGGTGTTLMTNNSDDTSTGSETSTQVSVSKTDTDGNLLGGAVLRITDTDGKTVVTDWTSSAKEARLISGVLVAGKTYVLVEITAPNGYELAAPVTFTVNAVVAGSTATDLENAIQKVMMTDEKSETSSTTSSTTSSATSSATTSTTSSAMSSITSSTGSSKTTSTITTSPKTANAANPTSAKTVNAANSTSTGGGTTGQHTNGPKTGDSSDSSLWLMIMSFAVGTVLFAAVLRKRKKTNQKKSSN